ncbi:MAG: segregation/condensation protein A [Cyanobacteria bacterium CRU_2_1]|nr:segregation/condensation protein A [Cyanobacteria bacterium RU_5_0]NJR62782.1 segregation/condensation protein A [Cyanobacteria bacterium CRU_2_1]
MTLSLAQNAIALLIDLAERGEIDPWDVKVIEVIDRFLSKLQPAQTVEAGRAPYEADLSQSGQAFLYVSMLLLLKADSLARQDAGAEESAEEDAERLEAGFANRPLPPNLERQIRRRAVAPPARNRRVTLQELIAQLNLISATMAEQKPRRLAARRPRPQSRSQAIRAISQLAHQENLSEIAAILEQFLFDHWQTHQAENWIDFEGLLDLWANAQVEAPAKPKRTAEPSEPKPSESQSDGSSVSVHDRVGVFWALLYLSAQSKVELAQEEFYKDLKVRRLTPEAVTDFVANVTDGRSDIP